MHIKEKHNLTNNKSCRYKADTGIVG